MTFPLNTSILTLSLPSSTNEDEREYHISDYFVSHPQRVLGDWCERPGSRGKPELSVRWPFAGSVVEGVSLLLSDVAKEIECTVINTSKFDSTLTITSFITVSDGDAERSAPEQAARDLYALAKNALACSATHADRSTLLRQAQGAYAAFKSKWGSLRGNLGKGGVLASTPLACSREAAFLAALETRSGESSRLLSNPTATADALSTAHRLIPSDALLVCLDERGYVDLDRIAALLTISTPDARTALLSEKLAFPSPPGCLSRVNLPLGCDIVSSMEYLTGDVGSKLAIAKSAAESDLTYAPNVEALTAALPDPLGPEDITIGLGAGWVPAEVYKDWLLSLFPGHKWGLSVEHLPSSAGWAIACTNPKLASDDGILRTQRFSGLDLLRDAINAKMPVAYGEWKDAEGKNHRVKNEILTMEAQARVSELRARFEVWAWQGATGGASESDAKRCALLCRIYNERFNGHVSRDFSGEHLTFRGLASTVGYGSEERAYLPKPRQLRGVAKVLAGGTRDRSAYLVYPPGFGKTDPAILSAVKLTQLGLARRTLIAVPKGVVGQWQARFLALFPGLADEVLCCDDPVYGIAGFKHTATAGYSPREAFLASMAAPGWRYLIVSHEMLREIPLSEITFKSLLDEELGELRECLRDAEEVGSKDGSKGARRSLRAREAVLQDMQAKHEAKWAMLRDRDRAPVSWEALSIDLFISDEFHAFKALGISTKMENVAGMPSGESQRAYDTFCKVQAVVRSGGRIGSLSGTPLTNSIAEAYIWQKILQPNLLRHLKLSHFDAWAQVFCEPFPSVELTCTGTYRTVTRLRYKNMPELIAILSECWDFVRELPDENLPQLHGSQVQVVSTAATPELRAYTISLAHRADLCRARKVDPRDDNLLKITSDGRRAALFNGPPSSTWPTHRVTKVDALAKNVWRHYCDSDALSGAQLVFIDLFTPKSNDGNEEYVTPKLTDKEKWLQTGVYGVIKAKLVAHGIAPDEIAFAHDYQTPRLRARLHSGIRSGHVRVCIGSTALIGLGVNVQDRGCALHHLDCPWRPDELEQRTKRFERQGNTFSTVHVYVYVTEGSYDPVVWQIVEGKARWQQQLYRGKVGRRSVEDVGAVVLTASLAKAVALGDTRVLEKVRLEGELALLEARWLSWSQGRGVLRRDVERLPAEIAVLTARAERLKRYSEVVDHVLREQALTTRSEGGTGKGQELGLCIFNSALGLPDSHAPTQTPGHSWPTTIDEANTLLRSAWLRHGQRPSNMLLGTWRGFALWVEYRKLGSVLSAYPVGDAVDGDGLSVMSLSFQSSRPADGMSQLLDVQRLAQDARLCEQRALGLKQRLTVAERDLGEVWALQSVVERQLLAYGRACEGRESVGIEGDVEYVAKLEPLRDAIVYRFKF